MSKSFFDCLLLTFFVLLTLTISCYSTFNPVTRVQKNYPEKMMESVNIVTASQMLGICRQRIQQLIYLNRVKGAFKTEKGWQIPLYGRMPYIIPAKRGMKGTWRTHLPKNNTIIHVNRQKIQANNRQEQKEPVIAVRIGSKVHYAHKVSLNGQCSIVYEPDNCRKNGGAKVWIEVSPTTKIMMTDTLDLFSTQSKLKVS